MKIPDLFILQARPHDEAPEWWPTDVFGNTAWVTLSKSAPPSWTRGADCGPEYLITRPENELDEDDDEDAVSLVDYMIAEWLDAYGYDNQTDDEVVWEFSAVDVAAFTTAFRTLLGKKLASELFGTVEEDDTAASCG